jgi:drug/metabolite transporter (DMT)-like permease
MPLALSRKDLLLLVVLTVLWGLNWPVMKAGVSDFAPLGFRTLCMAGGAVLLAAIARAQGHSLRVAREHWRELALLGLTNMVFWYVLSIYGVKLLSSGRAAILGYTMPVWTTLIGWMFYRDRLDARTALGVLAACAAIGLLLSSELGALGGRPLGALLMLGAAFTWAIGTQWMRRRTVPGSVVVLTFWMMLMALVTCSAISWTFERDQWVRWPNAVEWAAILYNVFLVFGVCQLLWFRLATILPPVASSLSVMLIPVVGLFSGMALLGERPTWHDWVALGFVLVSIGSVLLPASNPGAGKG